MNHREAFASNKYYKKMKKIKRNVLGRTFFRTYFSVRGMLCSLTATVSRPIPFYSDWGPDQFLLGWNHEVHKPPTWTHQLHHWKYLKQALFILNPTSEVVTRGPTWCGKSEQTHTTFNGSIFKFSLENQQQVKKSNSCIFLRFIVITNNLFL